MARLIAILRWIIAFSTVMFLAILAWYCLDIYLHSGQFTITEAASRLSPLKWPAAIYASTIAVTLIISPEQKQNSTKKSRDIKHRDACIAHSSSKRTSTFVRTLIFITSIILIIVGIWNGGLYDVLVKAINICTECIGLG